MGGRIAAQSREGEGSSFTFTIELPVVADTNARQRINIGSGLFEQAVLVIDDQDTSRSVIDHYLQATGADVISVASGVAGLGALARQSFDLIIVDHMMPGMDGPTFAEAVKTLNLKKMPKLILSSSAGYACTHAEAQTLGFDAALCKPIRKTSFDDAVREIYGNQKMDKAASCAPSPVDGKRGAMGPRVLLAEDNEVNQMLAKTQLERRGYVVDVAENGEEAVKLFESAAYDIVLMDMRMPEVDGLEATRRLRRTQRDVTSPSSP